MRRDLVREFGVTARIAGPLVGSLLLVTLARERRRLRRGWTSEPPTFFELNEAAARLEPHGRRLGERCRWVEAFGRSPEAVRRPVAAGCA